MSRANWSEDKQSEYRNLEPAVKISISKLTKYRTESERQRVTIIFLMYFRLK